MKSGSLFSRRSADWLSGILIYAWLTVLSPLGAYDAYYSVYYSVYILCGVFSLVCLCRQPFYPADPRTLPWRPLAFCSVLFSAAVLLANYALFSPLFALKNLLHLSLGFAGGFAVAWNILVFIFQRLPLSVCGASRTHSLRFFFLAFSGIALIDLFYLFFVSYPGVMTRDTMSTISQILGTSSYNNVMPFWHTMTVAPFVRLGLALFGDINGAVAFFHCVQILFMASVFACAMMTLYQIGVSRCALFAVYVLYALMPYQIVYSSTLWKDVPFSGAALLFITALYRILRNVGTNRTINYAMLCAGALGFSLWRTNGWYAFLVLSILLFPLLRKTRKPVLILILVLLVLTWVLLNPVLAILQVSELDVTEALAIPMQQIARVIQNERPLTAGETDLLDAVFDLEIVKDVYDPHIVDPVKFGAMRRAQSDYFLEHIGEYFSLYLRLGARYPMDFLGAWIDETKGYWNAGYHYWVYADELHENDFGLMQTQSGSPAALLASTVFRYVSISPVFQCFTSIGLYTWLLVTCFVMNLLKKREEYLLTIPILVLLAGLWIGTPVFAEFRYAYPMILAVPFLVCITLYWKKD